VKDTQRQSAARLSLLVARLSDLPALARCHARAVFARRLAKPAMGGAKKGALVGIAQQISNLGGTQPPIGEMLLYELTPRFVDKLGERGALAREAALERVIAHAQRCGNGRAQRRAVQQTARDRLASAMADVGVRPRRPGCASATSIAQSDPRCRQRHGALCGRVRIDSGFPIEAQARCADAYDAESAREPSPAHAPRLAILICHWPLTVPVSFPASPSFFPRWDSG